MNSLSKKLFSNKGNSVNENEDVKESLKMNSKENLLMKMATGNIYSSAEL
jgi:hypothetical protein